MQIKVIDFGGQWPTRAHYNDAGLDVKILEPLILQPGEVKAVPLGFGLEIPDGFTGLICPRSSLALKGLHLHLSPIDSGYHGEVHALVQNLSGDVLTFKEGYRIAQLVFIPIVLATLVEDLGEMRNTGRFGSTGC